MILFQTFYWLSIETYRRYGFVTGYYFRREFGQISTVIPHRVDLKTSLEENRKKIVKNVHVTCLQSTEINFGFIKRFFDVKYSKSA